MSLLFYLQGVTCFHHTKHKNPKKNQTGGHSRVRVYSDFHFSIEMDNNALHPRFGVSQAFKLFSNAWLNNEHSKFQVYFSRSEYVLLWLDMFSPDKTEKAKKNQIGEHSQVSIHLDF